MKDQLELRYVPLEQCLVWDKNPKKHDYTAILESIKKNGFKDPPKFEPKLNNGKGGIVEGNGRLTTLRDMHMNSEKRPRGILEGDGQTWLVPILFGVDAASQEAAESYAIDHNNITMLGGDFGMYDIAKMWDEQGYADILKELQDVNLPPVSMDFDDIGAFLNTVENGNAELASDDEHAAELVDKAEELNKKWQVKLGDLWECGEHRIICGDCTDLDVIERLLNGEKANICFTDPPYGVSIGKKNNFLNSFQPAGRNLKDIKDDDLKPEALKERLLPAFSNLRALVMADDCTVFMTAPQGGDLGLMMMMMMREAGLPIRHVLIWKKNQPTFSMGRLDYDYQHEPILMTWGKKHKRPMLGNYRTSVWEIDKPRASAEHPTMKPVELYVNAYLNNSDVGDITYDPFAGSGTAILASENTNRKCRAIELNPAYVAVALQRWSDLTGQEPKRLSP